MKTSKRLALCAALAAAFAAPSVHAQATKPKFPEGPLRIIVPFAAGGGVDQAARLFGKQMQSSLAVPVVVENRGGASGTLGGKAVQTAAPDGQTVLFSAFTHILTKQVLAAPPYDPITDFAPVARVGEAPLLMVISPTLAPKTLTEVVAAAKAQPDKWTATLPALGAPSHLATLLLARQTSLNLQMVPYKGTAPALVDVAGGHAQILMDSIVSILPMAKSGKVKPIAVTSAKRSGVAPEIPTAAEAGYPGIVFSTWYAFWAPKDTPADRIAVLHKAANDAAADLVKSGSLTTLGIDAISESIEQFRKAQAATLSQSAELLKGAGFKPE